MGRRLIPVVHGNHFWFRVSRVIHTPGNDTSLLGSHSLAHVYSFIRLPLSVGRMLSEIKQFLAQ